MSCKRLILGLLALLTLAAPAAAEDDLSPYLGGQIDRQPMGENLCAITFDDGPSAFTDHLLDELDGFGIPATFFMLGQNARAFPETVRRALAEGHEVESHSYSHPNLKTLSPQRRRAELERTNEILRALGAEPRLLRPPYGAQDAQLVSLAAELGLRVITWSLDSLDWKRLPEDYTRIPNVRGRAFGTGHLRGIFLFHDIHKGTVDDLPRIVSQLRAGGCQRFVTVSDYMDAFFVDPEPPMIMARAPRPAMCPRPRAYPADPALSPGEGDPAAAPLPADPLNPPRETPADDAAPRSLYQAEIPLPPGSSFFRPAQEAPAPGRTSALAFAPAVSQWPGFVPDRPSIRAAADRKQAPVRQRDTLSTWSDASDGSYVVRPLVTEPSENGL